MCGFFLYEPSAVEALLHGFGRWEGVSVSLLLVNPLIRVGERRERYVVPSRLNGYALVCGDSRCGRLYGLYKRCSSCEKVYGLDLCLKVCSGEQHSSLIEDLKKQFARRSLDLLGGGWLFEAGCTIGPAVPAGFLDYLRVSSAQDILLFRRADAGEAVARMRAFRFWRLFKPLAVAGGEEAANAYAKAVQRREPVKSFEGVVERLKAIVETVRDRASRAQLPQYTPAVKIEERRRRMVEGVKVERFEEVVEEYLGGLESFLRWAKQHSHIVAPEARLVVES